MKTFVMFPSLILILSISAVTANAVEAREIALIDGSIITGDVLSLAGGICTIKSDSLSIIKLEESKIRAIMQTLPAMEYAGMSCQSRVAKYALSGKR